MAGAATGGEAEPAGVVSLGRLTRPSEFRALRSGKRIHAAFGRLQGIARADQAAERTGLRFGLIVPKKLGNAPQRNRIKRRLREGLRQALASGCFEFGGKSGAFAGFGADIGIFPSDALLATDFQTLVGELCASVDALMRKLGRHPI
jgi:ribonuclease P protein component